VYVWVCVVGARGGRGGWWVVGVCCMIA